VKNALAATTAGDARRYAPLPNPFTLYRGGLLHGAEIAYECWGALNKKQDNAILLFTGLSPSAHAASSTIDTSEGWWEQMIGPGRAIDTRRYFVICVNSLGSCFGSTGPASLNPETGKPYRLNFPALSIEDVARCGHAVVQSLGIAQLDTVIGPSLGGMAVLAFAAQFPNATRRLISISGSAAASPFAIALRSIQREAILRDPQWRDGEYLVDQPPANGMRLARKLGTMTYRSATEWRQRFDRELIKPELQSHDPFAIEFAVEAYLEAHAQRFVRAFDPACYIYLSKAMDRFDLAAHQGSSQAALAASGLQQALVIGVESDMLFAINEQRDIATACETAGIKTQFAALDCMEGHDSFLIDFKRFGSVIGEFLQ
jgi:homoserine O-acetyltransferase/O-succinyltransferase